MAIKTLIVDDSILFRTKIASSLASDGDIEIVGFATNTFEATELIKKLNPDVLILDVELPREDGITFLKNLIPKRYIPVIVVSSTPLHKLTAREAGAVDFVPKPFAGEPRNYDDFAEQIKYKIKLAAAYGLKKQNDKQRYCDKKILANQTLVTFGNEIVAIGASTGGTEAIYNIVKDLPSNFPAVIIVQHMPEHFTKLYAERLDKTCKMRVVEATDGDRVETGKVIVAAGNFHLSLKQDVGGYYVSSKQGEKIGGHCPSVNFMFESVAKIAGKNAVGVILTGMGADGATGITEMKKCGAHTIGQDKESCVVYGMPMEAFKLGGVCVQLPLDRIASELINYFSKPRY